MEEEEEEGRARLTDFCYPSCMLFDLVLWFILSHLVSEHFYQVDLFIHILQMRKFRLKMVVLLTKNMELVIIGGGRGWNLTT